MTGDLHVSRPRPGILLLEIDNPPVNAMTEAMLDKFTASFGEVDAGLDIRCLVVTGRGRSFCSGEDIKTAAPTGDDLNRFMAMLDRLEQTRVPTIAAINGFCIGGGFELALCCDIRIASTEASFVCAGVNVGLISGTYRLPRVVGVSCAKAWMFTGARHGAEDAKRRGLVSDVHQPDDLQGAALDLAARIASRAPLSVETTKRLLDDVEASSGAARTNYDRELKSLLETDDHREAMKAFADRSEPTFKRG